MVKVTKRLWWFAGALGLILLGSSLLLPSLIKTQLQTQLAQALHRPVSLGDIQFSLWSGRVELQDLKVLEPDGKSLLLGVEQIQLHWSAQSLWQRAPILQSLTLVHPRLHLVVLGPHQLNVSDLLAPDSSHHPSSDSLMAFAVHQLVVSEGAIDWEDRLHHTHHQLDHLQLLIPLVSTLEGPQSPALEPHLEAQLDGTGLQLTGHVQPFAKTLAGQLQISVHALPVPHYLADLPPTPNLQVLGGLASLHLQIAFAPGAAPGALRVNARGELLLEHATLHLHAPHALDLAWDKAQAQLQGLVLDWPSGALQLDQLQLDLHGVTVTDAALQPARPWPIARIELALQPLRWPLSLPGTPSQHSKTPDSRVDLHVQLAASSPALGHPKGNTAPAARPRTQSLRLHGTIQWQPLLAQGDLELNNLDLAPFNPYLLAVAPVLLARGELGLRGHLTLQQPEGAALQESYQGQLLVTHLRVLDAVDAQELGQCRTLFLTGIDLRGWPPSITIGQLVLDDFSTRLVLNPQGHLNLEQLTAAHPPATSPPLPTVPASNATRATPQAPDTAPLRFRIGKVILQGGHVHYRDHYIQPHFSADLENLGGVIAPLTPGQNARIDLRGRVNTAPLTIQGWLDPTMQALALDVHGQVTGMDLSPMTPYANKYLGYGIAQGKLSFQADYQVRQQQLTAQNHLVLDQLKLGPAVHSPQATHLPVELALSLLQDSNGVIDVHLPIQGALDDPQFSVSGIVLRMLENLLEKALTSPFEMLQSFFEDHSRASWIPFDPGDSSLNASALKKLQAMSHALQARPRLKLDLQGQAVAAADAEPLRQQWLARQIHQLWMRQQLASGKSVTSADHPPPGEERRLLQQVYEQTNFVKPRNVLGCEKQLSVEEMKKLLLANRPVEGNALEQLARQRAQSAQDWLNHTGGIAAERLSVIQESHKQAAAISSTAPGARVDFFLH